MVEEIDEIRNLSSYESLKRCGQIEKMDHDTAP